MSSTLEDRYARLAALRPPRKREMRVSCAPERITLPGALAELLGAAVAKNRYGEHLVVRRWYPTPEACEPDARALDLLLPREPGRATEAHSRAADPANWLFLDTETTGLAGGTGTYAFLVGI